MAFPHRPKAIGNAANQIIAAAITGGPDGTISAGSYVGDRDNVRHGPRKFIDTLFFGEKHHCLIAYITEGKRYQMPPCMSSSPSEEEMEAFEKTYGYRYGFD